MQSNLYVHTKYENIEETYLYPIWEFFSIFLFLSHVKSISKDVWEYKIGAYQVMAKYLKDRKKEKRKLSLEEMGHYMRVAKAIERTVEVQGEVEEVFGWAVVAKE